MKSVYYFRITMPLISLILLTTSTIPRSSLRAINTLASCKRPISRQTYTTLPIPYRIWILAFTHGIPYWTFNAIENSSTFTLFTFSIYEESALFTCTLYSIPLLVLVTVRVFCVTVLAVFIPVQVLCALLLMSVGVAVDTVPVCPIWAFLAYSFYYWEVPIQTHTADPIRHRILRTQQSRLNRPTCSILLIIASNTCTLSSTPLLKLPTILLCSALAEHQYHTR